MVHSQTDRCVMAYLYPLLPRDIRCWLIDRQRQGHIAKAMTPLVTFDLAVFHNVRLSPAKLPLYVERPITVAFADPTIAMLFKLTFCGNV